MVSAVLLFLNDTFSYYEDQLQISDFFFFPNSSTVYIYVSVHYSFVIDDNKVLFLEIK